MRSLLLLLTSLIFLSPALLNAQSGKKPTEKEIEQMAKDMQKRAQSGKPMSQAEMKEMMKKMGVDQDVAIPDVVAKEDPKPSGPKTPVTTKPLHGKELADFVTSIRVRLLKKMEAGDTKLVYDLIAELDSSIAKIEQMAIYAFYKGARAQGVLLATEAVLLDPKNDLHVNNLAGMLINLGVFEQALPVMRGLVSRYPNDDMMCNNLGQAYMGLGKKDSALKYLERSMKGSPGHPQATATASQINKSKGNKQVALEQARVALKRGINLEAAEFINDNDPSPDAFAFLVENNKAPDYFNLYGIKKPMHPTSVDQVPQAEAERAAYNAELERLEMELSGAQNREQKLGEEQLQRDLKKFRQIVFSTGKAPKNYLPVSAQVAVRVMGKNRTFLQDDWLKVQEEGRKYEEFLRSEEVLLDTDMETIFQFYEEKIKKLDCGEGKAADCAMMEQFTRERCKAQNQRINLYLQAAAGRAEAFDQKQLLHARQYFYFYSKWYVMAAPNQHLASAAFYHVAGEYLKRIRTLRVYKVFGPRCERLNKLLEKYTFRQLMEPPCNVDAELDYGILNIKAGCKEFEMEVEILDEFALNFKKDFESSSSTLSVVHTVFEAGGEIPGMIAKTIGLEAGAKAEVKESLYITLDGDGKTSDVGYRVNTAAELKLEMDSGDIHKGGSIKVESEISVGINSGLNTSITPFAAWFW